MREAGITVVFAQHFSFHVEDRVHDLLLLSCHGDARFLVQLKQKVGERSRRRRDDATSTKVRRNHRKTRTEKAKTRRGRVPNEVQIRPLRTWTEKLAIAEELRERARESIGWAMAGILSAIPHTPTADMTWCPLLYAS